LHYIPLYFFISSFLLISSSLLSSLFLHLFFPPYLTAPLNLNNENLVLEIETECFEEDLEVDEEEYMRKEKINCKN
jgi:hypothetical protein